MSNVKSKQKLYIMKNSLGLKKIGISVNPEKRAKDISNASGFKTEVVKIVDVENALEAEGILHKHFKEHRKEGEWFKGIPAKKLTNKYLTETYKKKKKKKKKD